MNQRDNFLSGPAKWGLYALAATGLFTAARNAYRQMSRYDFGGKVVIITGGARGLGLLLARACALKGARIVICSRSADQLENAEKELVSLGAQVFAIAADLTEQQDAQRVVAETVERFGSVDVLINNAGVMTVGPQDVMDIQDYKKAMDTNLWAALYMIKAALPHLKESKGRIANICSIGGKVAVPHLLPYSVSKFAMVGLSEGLHAELKSEGVHVTTVIPNLMQTGSPRNISLKGDHEAEYTWFKAMGSSPLFSQDATKSAKQIVKAIEFGERELVLTVSGKLSVALQGANPGLVSSLAATANRFMPKNGPNGFETKKGYETEAEQSGLVSEMMEEEAVHNNEL